MASYFTNQGSPISRLTVRKYMLELGIQSVIRKNKPKYQSGKQHKTFPNLLQRDFSPKAANEIWCTDFTYIFDKHGNVSYNCTIIDLFRREVIATKTEENITSSLAINTLSIAILKRKPGKGLILHSDQGSQYTSKAFVDYCKEHLIQQSMSKAGCPYDNAVMERYFNTLKYECINLYAFQDIDMIENTINEYVYGWYNPLRPHTFNDGKPPCMQVV